MNARLPAIVVPDGFTIPFYYYDEFIKRNKLDDTIFGLLNDQKFVHDPAYRRERWPSCGRRSREPSLMRSYERRFWRKSRASIAGKGSIRAEFVKLGRPAEL